MRVRHAGAPSIIRRSSANFVGLPVAANNLASSSLNSPLPTSSCPIGRNNPAVARLLFSLLAALPDINGTSRRSIPPQDPRSTRGQLRPAYEAPPVPQSWPGFQICPAPTRKIPATSRDAYLPVHLFSSIPFPDFFVSTDCISATCQYNQAK